MAKRRRKHQLQGALGMTPDALLLTKFLVGGTAAIAALVGWSRKSRASTAVPPAPLPPVPVVPTDPSQTVESQIDFYSLQHGQCYHVIGVSPTAIMKWPCPMSFCE